MRDFRRTLILLGLATGLVVWVALRNPPHSHPPVSRTKSDLRTMMIAIKTYQSDHGAGPMMRPFVKWEEQDDQTLQKLGAQNLAFVDPGGAGRAGLTTPVAYLTSLFLDPYTQDQFPFAYWTDGERIAVWSAGPDHQFNLQNPDLLDSGREIISYDPTNGTGSSGDIFWLSSDFPDIQ